MSPTITSPAMTMAGVILGTAAYMSPEQTRGRSVDKVQFIITPYGRDSGLSPLDRPFAISRSGDEVAFVLLESLAWRKPARPIDDSLAEPPDFVPVAGTDGARSPFFSPGGEWIGFFVDRRVRKVQASGGGGVTIAKVSGGHAEPVGEPTARLSSRRTTLKAVCWPFRRRVATPEYRQKLRGRRRVRDHIFPYVLPSGRAVVFTQAVFNRTFQLAVLDLASGDIKPLNIAGSHPEHLDSLGLIYWSGGTLHSVGFDSGGLSTIGEPRIAAQGLTRPFFDVSKSGTLVAAYGMIEPLRGSGCCCGSIGRAAKNRFQHRRGGMVSDAFRFHRWSAAGC